MVAAVWVKISAVPVWLLKPWLRAGKAPVPWGY